MKLKERARASLVMLACLGALAALLTPFEGAAGVEPSPFLTGIWGVDGGDVWAVGEAGVIMHFDGRRWAEVESPTERDLTALWGSSSDDVWAVGEGAILHWDSREWVMGVEPSPFLRAIWGSGPEDVWAVGDRGGVLHYDGSAWTEVDTGYEADFQAVWGSGAEDIWVAGGGVVIHFNGYEWVAGVEPSPFLNALWGSRSSDVWAVGDEGSLLHFGGRGWREVSSGTEADLLGVWGSSSGDVWAVGEGGVVLHYDGRRWGRYESGTERNLHSVWVSVERDVLAAGDHVIWMP